MEILESILHGNLSEKAIRYSINFFRANSSIPPSSIRLIRSILNVYTADNNALRKKCLEKIKGVLENDAGLFHDNPDFVKLFSLFFREIKMSDLKQSSCVLFKKVDLPTHLLQASYLTPKEVDELLQFWK